MFEVNDFVKVSEKSKSKYKEAYGVVQGYCNGHYNNICKVKLWRNKIIKIFDDNLIKISREDILQ